MHDFLTVGAPAPLQAAGAVGMRVRRATTTTISRSTTGPRRDSLCDALSEAGFSVHAPEGAYYVLADFSGLSDMDDVAFAKWLCAGDRRGDRAGLELLLTTERSGKSLIRFAFCKKYETLEARGGAAGDGARLAA